MQSVVRGRTGGRGKDRDEKIGLLLGQLNTHNYLKKQSLFSESHLVSDDGPGGTCMRVRVGGQLFSH